MMSISVSKWINKYKHNCIPVNSIIKPPSAELAPNQVDPYDYSIVSPLVDGFIEMRKSPSALIEEGFEKLVYQIYNKIRINEYKRRQSSTGVKSYIKIIWNRKAIPCR